MLAPSGMSETNPSPPSGDGLRLLPDMTRVAIRLWPWLILLALMVGLQAALQPSVGWMGKRVIDGLQANDASLHTILLENGLLFAAVFLAITVIKAGEKISSKAFEIRLIIALQRIFIDRRQAATGARDVSQMFYGSDVAKRGFEVFVKDFWVITFKTGSVVIWQMTLAPEWLPLLFLATIPAVAAVALLGPAIRRASKDILGLQEALAATVARPGPMLLRRVQERLFGRFLRFETLKVVADEMIDLLIWFNAVLLIALSYVLDFGLLPDRVAPGDLALVAINLKLLSEPLGHIGKVYTKWQEAQPALHRIFTGDHANR